jgi:hypothetical protein
MPSSTERRHSVKSLEVALLAALVTLAWATPAYPWPYPEVTGTEVLSTEPLRVRTTCTITEVGFRPIYGEIYITPLDHATTRIYECGATPPLECYYSANGTQSAAGLSWISLPVKTFWIVSNQATPCVKFQFIDNLLGGHQYPIYADDIDACLSEDLPVPAVRASWGSVKSLYR